MTTALARKTDPATSHAAARQVRVNPLHARIVRILALHPAGLTTTEIGVRLQLARDSISPRMKFLVQQLGWIEDTGEVRVPFTGGTRQQIVWRITEAGKLAYEGRYANPA